MEAIQAHRSSGNSKFPSSEANKVIDNFNNLSESDQAGPPQLPAVPVALPSCGRGAPIAGRAPAARPTFSRYTSGHG